jgi:mercuric ion transport protein
MIGGGTAGRPAGLLGAAPTAALVLLPKLTCAACWPAYSAALGGLGLRFFDYTPYLLPLTLALTAVSLAALGLTARARRSPWPLVGGVLGAAALLVGRFALDSDVLTYAGVGLFLAAAFFPGARRRDGACSRCVSVKAEETRP